jgi:hypothetical protein
VSNALDVSYGIEEAESCIMATKFMFCVVMFVFNCRIILVFLVFSSCHLHEK